MPELARKGPIEFVRLEFLKKVSHLSPTVSDDLYRKCYPEFHRLHLEIEHTINLALLRSEPRLASLYEILKEWAKEYNLEADWCYERALEQLFDWCIPVSDDEDDLYEVRHKGWGGVSVSLQDNDDSIPPPIGFPSYAPGAQSRGDYLEQCKVILETELNRPLLVVARTKEKRAFRDSIMEKVEQYCEEVENWFKKNQGWLSAKMKNNLDRNLGWAVKVQIIGITASQISEEEEMDISTVTRAVEDILSLIELPRSLDFKQGRKPGPRARSFRRHLRR